MQTIRIGSKMAQKQTLLAVNFEICNIYKIPGQHQLEHIASKNKNSSLLVLFKFLRTAFYEIASLTALVHVHVTSE